ncbi:peptidoglycan DD-metalloendopeptidase family protein [Lysinibacillus sphaericus]|uniref:Stage II sporulation protein n=1 Tax=Lysinibacillus sphaericus OT4b.31 TaxID=1285586 RepID=R7ZJ12_LYSSH|nr:M23 family metallopeptidase [Lysinibacillus sphaericus]EON74034.1 stage II sporulation protein [Lysinibacillus sphaericus OT4b.31]
MREDKNSKTSQKEQLQKKPWFWPAVYAGGALMLAGILFGYNSLVSKVEEAPLPDLAQVEPGPVVETNARTETMKYPFKETNLSKVQVSQEFYELEANEESRENALMVFNQTFTTSSGISLSMNGEEFEVVAALSGKVLEVKLDAFTGNKIVLEHSNGKQTQYSSVKDIAVKEGDEVTQGQVLGKATDNEWNQAAGVHMHFEVLENGKFINPKKLLAF